MKRLVSQFHLEDFQEVGSTFLISFDIFILEKVFRFSCFKIFATIRNYKTDKFGIFKGKPAQQADTAALLATALDEDSTESNLRAAVQEGQSLQNADALQALLSTAAQVV